LARARTLEPGELVGSARLRFPRAARATAIGRVRILGVVGDREPYVGQVDAELPTSGADISQRRCGARGEKGKSQTIHPRIGLISVIVNELASPSCPSPNKNMTIATSELTRLSHSCGF
jgi:hypothetical protein